MNRGFLFGVSCLFVFSLVGCGQQNQAAPPGPAAPPPVVFAAGNYYRYDNGSSPLVLIRNVQGRQRILLLDRCGTRLVSGSFRARAVIEIKHESVACEYRLSALPNGGLQVIKVVPAMRLERTYALPAIDRNALGRELIRRHGRLALRNAEVEMALLERFYEAEFEGLKIPRPMMTP